MSRPNPEHGSVPVPVATFTGNRIENPSAPTLRVDSKTLGVSAWQGMLDATGRDNVQRVLDISKGRFGKPRELRDDNFLDYRAAARSLFINDDVVVNTHPTLEDPNNDPRFITDGEIKQFLDARDLRALVVIRPDGVHLLGQASSMSREHFSVRGDLAQQTITEVEGRGGSEAEVVKVIADKLAPNLAYFYAPLPSPDAEYVEFQNARSIKPQLAE